MANKVNLSNTSNINGDVNANDITVEGTIKGSLTAKKVAIKKGCNFEGDVVGESISIEEGSNIKIQALTKKGV